MDHDNLLTHVQTKSFFDVNYFELLLSKQKLGTFLKNKAPQKLKFSKNVNNKKCAPKMISFNEKKIESLDNFRHRKLTLKVKKLQTAEDQK